jgi:isopenicillin N synthase-like dioxygenase
MAVKVPLIDLRRPAKELAGELATACSEWGFFQLVNHGLAAALLQETQELMRDFFAQPAAAKQAFSRELDSPWGFYDRELTRNLRDRKEIFDFCLEEKLNWPCQPAGFEATMRAYASHCHKLGLRLMALACAGLGLESDRLESHFAPCHSSFTRLNYYPTPSGISGEVGPLGISRHTDAGALTLLLQDRVAGLQVYKGGKWLDVEPRSDAFTVNVGDMLQVWSNDRYRAPLHRVLASSERERYSIAYFLNPDYDCVVTPQVGTPDATRYRAISWREFRELRALGDYGDYGEEVQLSHYRHSAKATHAAQEHRGIHLCQDP